MGELLECIIYYPEIEHPLRTEKDSLKRIYVALLRQFADKYDSKKYTEKKLGFITGLLFGKQINENIQEEDSGKKETIILRTRFTPFKFFSYRYIFLFDCLLLFAIDDKDKGTAICEELKKNIHKRYHKRIDYLIRQMYEEDEWAEGNTLITNEMQKAWINARRYVRSNEHIIVFTATMSAGKSTLINAIVGDDLSGAKKAACTSKVIRIHSMPSNNGIYMMLDKGQWNYLVDLNSAKKCILENGNDTELAVYFHSKLNEGRFTLVDTPGVNFSLNPDHKKIARTTLEGGIETIVYVIPVETYGESEDDYNHLMYILKKVSYKRIIFVVNMMDTIDSEDDSVEEILNEIKDHLQQIGFQNPIICPVSAKAGLQLKKMIFGAEMTDYEMKSVRNYINFFTKAEYALGGYNLSISENEREGYNYLPKKFDDQLWNAFVDTGIPGLEKLLYSE